MGKRKLKKVMWSMMFQIDPCKRTRDEMWEILHRFDREVPRAFCEWATDDWYTWHGFSTFKSMEQAVSLVFEEFPEVKAVDLFKDVFVTPCYCNELFRKTVTREAQNA